MMEEPHAPEGDLEAERGKSGMRMAAETPNLKTQQDPATRPQVDLSGQVLGDFQLLRLLGEGGMGQVYLAEQVSLRRRVALKLLRPELARDEISRRRFEAEAKAVAQLTHPNVVQVYSVGEHEGRHYMALEYVDGRNLRDYLARKGPPELSVVLSVARQVTSALQRAGELGIIHRDIKPENILLTKKGDAKVADFGLSRMIEGEPAAQNLTQTGVTMGTPLYMSPEQVEGRPLDPRTDIYSFGVTCYHMLAGAPPFSGDNAFAVALQHVQQEPPPLEQVRPDLPPELCAIVARMRAKKPDDRYQTPREILKDLKRFGDILSGGNTQPLIATTPTSRMAPLPEAARRSTTIVAAPANKHRRVPWWGAASLLIAAGAGSALGWYLRPPPIEEEPEQPAALSPEIGAVLDSGREQEEALVKLVSGTSNPGKDDSKIQDGLKYRIDLAYHYLSQQPRAVDKAKDLFEQMRKSGVPLYQQVAPVGEGIVKAFQDKTKESNDLFDRHLPGATLQEFATRPELTRNAKLRFLLAEALYHNHINCDRQKEPFPDKLRRIEELLKRATARVGG